MPTYEYECTQCSLKFEWRQGMAEEPLAECPECRGAVRRLISGGAGFIVKGSGEGRMGARGTACSLESWGKTCCGREERCEIPPCRGEG